MEVTGFVASIGTLLQITLKAAKYLDDVKNAPKDREKLAMEVTSLISLLTGLKYRLKEVKPTDPWFQGIRSLGTENGVLDQLQNCMVELAVKLKQTPAIKSIGKTLVWTLSKEKFKEILSTIERLKGSINLALQKDQFSLALASKKQLTHMGNNISEIKDAQEQKSIAEHCQKVLKWLSPLNFHQKQNDVLGSRQDGTGQWILDSDQFKNWMSGTDSVLWCPGIPGAGKTVIASIVIDQLRNSFADQDTGIAFLYCNYKEKMEQTPENLISSLWRQLIEMNPLLFDDLEILYNYHEKKNTRPSLDEVSKALELAIVRFSRTFIIIDALDECSKDNGTRSKLVHCLGKLANNTSFLFTSRPDESIEDVFPKPQEIRILASHEDVQTYLEARIRQRTRLARVTKSHADLRRRIVEKVSKTADGMFLLARLHMDSLEDKSTRNAVTNALEHLPKELNETYEEAMQRIKAQNEDDRLLAIKVLLWMTFALAPLRINQLQHALAVRPRARQLDDGDIIDEEILVSVCSGLVTIDSENGLIRLVHYTTQDYMKSIQNDWFADAQIEIAKTCIHYLSFDGIQDKLFANSQIEIPINRNNIDYLTFDTSAENARTTYWVNRKEREEIIRAYPFLDYATVYWADHVRGDGEYRIKDLILGFLSNKSLRVSYMKIRAHLMDEQFTSRSPLQVAAHSGLKEVSCDLVEKGASVDEQDGLGNTALMLATFKGHLGVVEILVDKGASQDIKDYWGRRALYHAAGNGDLLNVAASLGHLNIVEFLIDKVTKIDDKSRHGRTALHSAAIAGHVSVVNYLIDKGASIDTKDDTGETPFHDAAMMGNLPVINLFLEKGFDIDTPGGRGMTALDHAVSVGQVDAVGFLLDRGADRNARDIRDTTPLELGISAESTALVEILKYPNPEIYGWI